MLTPAIKLATHQKVGSQCHSPKPSREGFREPVCEFWKFLGYILPSTFTVACQWGRHAKNGPQAFQFSDTKCHVSFSHGALQSSHQIVPVEEDGEAAGYGSPLHLRTT